MGYDRTRLYGRRLDRERRRNNLGNELPLLRFTGKSAQGVIQYTVVSALTSGWMAVSARGSDGAFYTKLSVADGGTLESIIDGESDKITDFVVRGRVYKLEPDRIGRPLGEPRIWTLQGYDKNEVYTP